MAKRKHTVVGGSYPPDHAFKNWLKKHRFSERKSGSGATCSSCYTSLHAKRMFVRSDPDELLCEECARSRRKSSVEILRPTQAERKDAKPELDAGITKSDSAESTTKRSSRRRKKSNDALDHRLPGGYGTGKRR
jgi:hypothetical protein